VDVPDPDEVLRPSFEGTEEPENPFGSQQGPDGDDRWRHPRGPGDHPPSVR
jgi:cytochrome c oxidase subunit 1